jgi:hypothetical protein
MISRLYEIDTMRHLSSSHLIFFVAPPKLLFPFTYYVTVNVRENRTNISLN